MKKAALISLLFALPAVAFAQELDPIKDLIEAIGSIVATLIPILIGIALIAFFWGLVLYILKAGDEKAKEKGKRIMIAGLISLFVMVSVYGIIELAQNALGVESETRIDVPQFPGN